MEHRIEACLFVQILDAPVPQMGDQVVELLQKIVTAFIVEPVQVIAQPKISFDRIPQCWCKCQLDLGMRWQSWPRSSIRGVRFVVFSQDRAQQRLVQSSSSILQFLRVGGGVAEVFKVFSQNRVQQQRTCSRSSIFQLVVVFMVLSQARVPQLPHRIDSPFFQKVRRWVRTRGRNYISVLASQVDGNPRCGQPRTNVSDRE